MIQKKKRLAHPKKMAGLMREKEMVKMVKERRKKREKPHGEYPTKRSKGVKMVAEKMKNRARKKRVKTSWPMPRI